MSGDAGAKRPEASGEGIPPLGEAPGADPASPSEDERAAATTVVGIGASAGGLEALERFFEPLDPASGLAFVVIQHLSPDFESQMDALLARRTRMPVRLARDGEALRSNTVYLLPPKKEMMVIDRRVSLSDKDSSQALHLPIDVFFRSLASEYGSESVGIVLSGTGSDGSRGIRAIHEAGGVVLVQSEDSAAFDGMPKSAMATGVADFVLPPEEMAEKLSAAFEPSTGETMQDESALADIYTPLRLKYGIDFAYYKPTTVVRRIDRRLRLNQLDRLEDYARLLRVDPEELDALYRDLLIGVTRFFRDVEAFEVFRETVIPELFRRAAPDEDVRVWVPGCATGEEPYSIAILFQEYLRANAIPLDRVKIFATDVHDRSLEVASAGVFPVASVQGLSEQRLEQHFTRVRDDYRISSDIRRMVVFAPHNVIKDPPFTRIDLISCRNLLIYLKQVAQERVLYLFHFSLKAGGVLVLGPSESIGDLGEEFTTLDPRWKAFRKKRDVRLRASMGALPRVGGERYPPPAQGGGRDGDRIRHNLDETVRAATDRLVRRFVPAAVLVDEDRKLLHVFGEAGTFLRHRTGRADLDLLKLVEPDLRASIGAALHRAQKTGAAVCYRGIRLRRDDEDLLVEVNVEPQRDPSSESQKFMVTLEEAPTVVPAGEQGSGPRASEFDADAQVRITDLESELQNTKEHLQATIEELQTSNEELQATNEEMLASNEELQSTNEELHSVNEELYSVNVEYQRKIDELTQANNDLKNFLKSTDVGMIFLDKGLRIRMYTAAVEETLNLLPQDVGRPLSHLSINLDDGELISEIESVVRTGEVVEKDAVDRAGHDFLLRIFPYRDESGVVEGAVLTFVDVTSSKHTERELAASEMQFRQLAENIHETFWMTTADGEQLLYVSPSYERIWERSCESRYARPKSWLDAIHPEDRSRVVETFYGRSSEEPWEEEYRIVLSDGRTRWIRDRGFPVLDREGEVYRLAGIAEDVTERRRAATEVEQALEFMQAAVDGLTSRAAIVDDEGRIDVVNRAWKQAPPESGPPCEGLGVGDGYLAACREVAGEAGDPDESVALEVARGLADVLSGDRPSFSLEYAASEGEDPPWRRLLVSRFLHDGRRRAVVLIDDVTELRRAAEERRRLEVRMLQTQKLESLGVLAGGIAHDFNNLLVGILANAGRAADASSRGEDVGDVLRSIETSAQRASELCRQMLAYSGKGRFVVAVVDVSALVAEMFHLLEASISKRIEIRSELGEGLPPIETDATQLRQVVMNLITNAAEAIGDAPGTITIRTGVRACETAEIDSLVIHGDMEPGDYVFVEVRDTGRGMDDETAERIFEPFYSTKQTGRGLGLAAVQGIVHGHGGAIGVRSRPGSGTTMELLFPVSDKPHTAVETPAPPIRAQAGAGIVLVVDDEEVVRAVAEKELDANGFGVLTARDGQEALEVFRERGEHIALVLLDLTMPRLGGTETLERLRRIRSDVPVIVMSGFSESDAPSDPGTATPCEFLGKPWRWGELSGKVRAMLCPEAADDA